MMGVAHCCTRNIERPRGNEAMNMRCSHIPFLTKLSMLFAVASLMLPTGSAYSQASYKFDAATVSGLPARNIGSAVMSGRVAAVDAVDEDGRITVFVGAASGGVWKSVNGGTTYKSVFDRESVQSIGAVAI